MSREPLKTGDLCQLKDYVGGEGDKFVGRIYVLGRPAAWINKAWHFDPPVFVNATTELAWTEISLRKIDNPGDDEVDEISTRREVTA